MRKSREPHSGRLKDVRCGSKADISLSPTDVRFTSESGRRSAYWVRFVIRGIDTPSMVRRVQYGSASRARRRGALGGRVETDN